MTREENIIEPEEKPMHSLTKRPDDVEKGEKDETFFCEAGRGIFRCKERAVEGSPKEPEVKFHSGRDP